jgi:hypothetical protein
LAHHFGLPTLQATVAGIKKIAEAQVLDVISLGIDLDARENFFHPERQDPPQKGVGGIPVRTLDDFRGLYEARSRGNFPMLRTYSGTDDFIRYAEMLTDTIYNAWDTIPLFWFNQMDMRSPWDIKDTIHQHQQAMAWYGKQNIPVEPDEPHQWSMHNAPDVIYVVTAFLSAYNAKKYGVRDYIAQMTFNSSPGTSETMDLAKMLAILELITPLSHFYRGYTGERPFRIWKQIYNCLPSHPLDSDTAHAHLTASIYFQMAIKPHIYHIADHSEADYAANADDIIEATKIVRHDITKALSTPNMTKIPAVQTRAAELVAEACITLDAIRRLADNDVDDPWADAATLAKAVTSRVPDAPQLKNNSFGLGQIRTKIVNGACMAISETGHVLSERKRLAKFL